MIRAIVLDLGGTFASDPSPPTYRRLSKITGIEINKLLDVIKDNKDLVARGKQTVKDFWKNVRNDLKSDFNIDEIEMLFLKSLVPRKKMVLLVEKLKKKYKVGLLSNTERENFRYWRKVYSLDKIFDVIVTSFEAGSRKPEEKIYKVIIKKLSVKPNEIVFIDNQIKNVKFAAKLGIHAIHYDNYGNSLKKFNKLL